MTAAQFANQVRPVVAVQLAHLDEACGNRRASNIQIHALKRLFVVSLRAAGIPVLPMTLLDLAHGVIDHKWHDGEVVIFILLEETPVKSALEVLRSELAFCFPSSELLELLAVRIAHFDWNEGRWNPDFPANDTRPFAPWFDFLACMREWLAAVPDLGAEVKHLLGGTDA